MTLRRRLERGSSAQSRQKLRRSRDEESPQAVLLKPWLDLYSEAKKMASIFRLSDTSAC